MHDKWLDVITCVVSTGTLIFVAWQTREAASQSKALTRTLIASATESISKILIDLAVAEMQHPGVRRFFYDGLEINKGNARYDEVEAFAFAYIDLFDYYLVTKAHFADLPELTTRWDAWMVQMFRTSPLLRKVYSQAVGLYSKDLGSIYQKAVEALANQSQEVAR
jgi:hypothetical protein